MRKLGHSVIALLVFASSTFAISPMAFCRMQTEEPSCCEKPVKKSTHCGDSHADCPICSFELCKIDPTPAKPAVTTDVVQIDFVTIPVVTLTYEHVSFFTVPTPSIIDSGPPLYVLDCVFRI